MKLVSLGIKNYKSLRSMTFNPAALSVIVGSNGSGKTNLADSFDFLADVYRHGLELAVARKGGFENMAYRKMRRSKGGIGFDVCVELDRNDVPKLPGTKSPYDKYRYSHAFTLATKSDAIGAEFSVIQETLRIAVLRGDRWDIAIDVTRSGDDSMSVSSQILTQAGADGHDRPNSDLLTYDFRELALISERGRKPAPSELFVSSIGRYVRVIAAFANAAAKIRVFQISPTRSREFGVPIPRAELQSTGGNLPAVVNLLRRTQPDAWRSILSTMRAIIPRLRDIDVEYTSVRTLGLLFDEDGIGRPWTIGEVSDGTVQALALLVAIYDRRFSLLVIEEPENSLHPWILRRLIDACREAANSRQVIMTTHSPLLINSARPHEIFVIWRTPTGSRLAPIASLDPGFIEAWSRGDVQTFDVIDGGSIAEAIPPDPVEQKE